jgi:hypothetical protein
MDEHRFEKAAKMTGAKTMNRDAILFHLREAKEELDRTITEIEKSKSYDAGDFLPAMSHIYHHLNTAWNGRNAPAKRHKDCAKSDFDEWRKFPTNEDLLLI